MKYTAEAEQQLYDNQFYTLLDSDHDCRGELVSLVHTFALAVRAEVVRLIPSSPRPPTFYTLSKVHKLRGLTTKLQPNTDKVVTEEEVFDFVRNK